MAYHHRPSRPCPVLEPRRRVAQVRTGGGRLRHAAMARSPRPWVTQRAGSSTPFPRGSGAPSDRTGGHLGFVDRAGGCRLCRSPRRPCRSCRRREGGLFLACPPVDGPKGRDGFPTGGRLDPCPQTGVSSRSTGRIHPAEVSIHNVSTAGELEPGSNPDSAGQDYATGTRSARFVIKCRCGSVRCRRTITGNDWGLPELQHIYGGHRVPALLTRIRSSN
jgi:hypothetical protein